MSNNLRPFHLAFPVTDIKETIRWYKSILNCTVGRQDTKWVDFNFYGHQLSAHLVDQNDSLISTNTVDSKHIPARHFGVILNIDDWQNLCSNLKKKEIIFLIEPHIRFKHKKGEQSTMFIKDPSGNVLEFKAFKNDSMIFNN